MRIKVRSILLSAAVLGVTGVAQAGSCGKPACASSVACTKACVQYQVGYVEEQVTVKKPVLIKRTPIVETREKQITVKEQVVTGYKEEVVECAPPVQRKPLLGGLFKNRLFANCGCGSCN